MSGKTDTPLMDAISLVVVAVVGAAAVFGFLMWLVGG